jgi:putative Ca2+/H+ antiporter (TMEM165/GDT1 family)
VTAGGLLSLLPHRILETVVTVLFLVGAAYLWWSAGKEEAGNEENGNEENGNEENSAAGKDGAYDSASDPSGGQVSTVTRPSLTAFATAWVVVFIGEWGDITQILTANLAAKYHDPVAVGIGAVLGLWTAALLAISLGRTLLRYLSIVLLQRVGALLLLCLGVYSAWQTLLS